MDSSLGDEQVLATNLLLALAGLIYPSTHWCFFLADLDGASQVKYLLQYKDGFA